MDYWLFLVLRFCDFYKLSLLAPEVKQRVKIKWRSFLFFDFNKEKRSETITQFEVKSLHSFWAEFGKSFIFDFFLLSALFKRHKCMCKYKQSDFHTSYCKVCTYHFCLLFLQKNYQQIQALTVWRAPFLSPINPCETT